MRSRTYEAVVLKTADVGEADRFCILYTRESGRVATRARGVRKPGSRIGGTLLPLAHVRVQIAAKEHPGVVQSVSEVSADDGLVSDYKTFSRAQQGIEVLLSLTEDDDPMPELFESLVAFIRACGITERNPVPAFIARTLALLGVLPLHDDDLRYARLSDAAKAVLQTAAGTADPGRVGGMQEPEVRAYLRAVLADTLPRPLRAEELQL